MFQRILVPLDGSACAERALPIAASIARASGGKVIVLRVVTTRTEVVPSMGVVQPARIAQAIVDVDLAEAEQYLADLTITGPLTGIPTEAAVLTGTAASTILSVASSYRADVIVLCGYGSTGLKRWMGGSVAEKVVHHALIPVLLLRECGPLPGHLNVGNGQPLRVLVPLDGSAYAKTALAPAAELIAMLSAPARGALHLLRVVKPVAPELKEEDPNERQKVHPHKAEAYLKAAIEHLHAGLIAPGVAPLNLSITWSAPVNADIAAAIIQAAEHGEENWGTGVDVIAIATHGRHGLQRWAMGSVTERVLNATRLPLLIVRPVKTSEKIDLVVRREVSVVRL